MTPEWESAFRDWLDRIQRECAGDRAKVYEVARREEFIAFPVSRETRYMVDQLLTGKGHA